MLENLTNTTQTAGRTLVTETIHAAAIYRKRAVTQKGDRALIEIVGGKWQSCSAPYVRRSQKRSQQPVR